MSNEVSPPQLPVKTIADALPALRLPFTAEAIKWKIQVNPKDDNGRALIVGFIDARLVAERLNAVCPDMWEDEYHPVDGGLECRITLTENVLGTRLTRRDVGWSKGRAADMDLKALYSDAFKRAAVKFGIGVSIYAMPQGFLKANDGSLKKLRSGYVVTDAGLAKLRKAYERWLAGPGKTFGVPLDHGDTADSQGDIEAGAGGAAVEQAPAQAEKPKAPRKVSKTGLEAIAKAKAAAGATDDDVKTWLVAKGAEDVSDLDAALAGLTADQAKELHEYLKGSGE